MAVKLKRWKVNRQRALIELELDEEAAEDLLDALAEKDGGRRERMFWTMLLAHALPGKKDG